MNPVGMFRSYKVVSSRGTNGTRFQQLLAFTTARQKAPDGIIASALRHFHIGHRLRLDRDAALRGARRALHG